MNTLNNIFDNLSRFEIDLSLDLSTATDNLRKDRANTANSQGKSIYGENIYHDYDYSDNSSELNLNSNRFSHTVTDIRTQTTAIGYNNTSRLFTGRGNDRIIGLGNATVTGSFRAIAESKSTSVDNASADSNARAVFTATVEATGVRNSSGINTARGNDTIIGVSDVQSNASVLAESTAIDLSLATAQSESSVAINVLAIGVDNGGNIALGQGKDLFVGIANTSTQSEAKATAIANAFDVNLSPAAIAELNNATAESDSLANATNSVSTLGIANAGKIFLNQGNDVIFGLANSQSSTKADSDSQATSSANQSAIATANAEAIAVTQDDTVGIVNAGLIATGFGNDILVGLAFNQPQAIAEANADANGTTTDTGANTDTRTVSDTSNAIAIGIDNTSGIIRTGIGNDRIIAYGSNVGITGGRIKAETGNDKILGYGGLIGVNATRIDMGRGHDYFQAAIAEVDPLTGSVNLAEDQTNSIRNSRVFGDAGNDTFEIGGFDGRVLIDGGRDFDTLKLSGDIDSYEFSVTGSNNQNLTIEDSGSILTVVNVEAIYLGNSEQLSVSDFA